MNPYLNSLNGWGGGFIAFWPSVGVIIPPAIRKQVTLFMRDMGKMMNP